MSSSRSLARLAVGEARIASARPADQIAHGAYSFAAELFQCFACASASHE